jgi:hypothetical protein
MTGAYTAARTDPLGTRVVAAERRVERRSDKGAESAPGQSRSWGQRPILGVARLEGGQSENS